MADSIKNAIQGQMLPRRFVDNGDGTFSEKVALTADDPITLTGDVVLDTFGTLGDSAETDPDAASATIPALLRGILAELKAQTALLTQIQTNTSS